jgi:hypothetical protein
MSAGPDCHCESAHPLLYHCEAAAAAAAIYPAVSGAPATKNVIARPKAVAICPSVALCLEIASSPAGCRAFGSQLRLTLAKTGTGRSSQRHNKNRNDVFGAAPGNGKLPAIICILRSPIYYSAIIPLWIAWCWHSKGRNTGSCCVARQAE